MNVRRTILFAAILAVAFFGFFGVITYQNTEALSTVRQQTVLHTLSAIILGDAEKAGPDVWESSDWLNSQPILDSSGFPASSHLAAFVLNQDGDVINRTHSLAPTDHPMPVEEILSSHAGHEQSLTAHGCRYVWTLTALPNSGGSLVLVHASNNNGITELVQLYLVPTIITILMIIWALVWVRLSVLRRIQSMARQEQLETELVREQEASRIKSAFLANMSHELRTPLNAIIGFAQMLRNETFGPLGSARNTEYVQIIHDAGMHLSRLIGHVLDLSQVEAGSTDLHETENRPEELFEECLMLARSQVESRDQKTSIYVDPGIGTIVCDRLRIIQVLLNLLANASKFSPPESSIRLEAGCEANGDLVLQVIDQGRGIHADEIATVLKPFGQAEVNAETARDGTGLGLPLSLALIELHGGSLTIDSVPGKGTKVSARLPASRHRPATPDSETDLLPPHAVNQ
ncbi:MAG: HAMP domain-containing sensor histidine kinase [Minwuia sp.]|nr:HAMP domain-containing sensor histidine kinase [Minwuia sp.]